MRRIHLKVINWIVSNSYFRISLGSKSFSCNVSNSLFTCFPLCILGKLDQPLLKQLCIIHQTLLLPGGKGHRFSFKESDRWLITAKPQGILL